MAYRSMLTLRSRWMFSVARRSWRYLARLASVAVCGPFGTAPRKMAWVFVDLSTSRGVDRRCPSLSRSMSVPKLRRWSSRTEARMVNGMKAMGNGILSSEAANRQRLDRNKANLGLGIPSFS